VDGAPIELATTVVNANEYQAANSTNNSIHNGTGQINVADGSDLCIGKGGMTFYDLGAGGVNTRSSQPAPQARPTYAIHRRMFRLG
jgi:hypothetical protein